MNVSKLICTILLFFLFSNIHTQDHPFLIVNESMYPELQTKHLSGNPFAFMRSAALGRWDNAYDPNNIGSIGSSLNYNTMAYILDADNANRINYKNKIIELLDAWGTLSGNLNGGHGSYVGGSSTQFLAIIALDVIYNELSTSELAIAEADIEVAANFYVNTDSAWKLSGYGANLLYAIYKKDTAQISYWKSKYDSYLFDKSMTNDNSWGQCSGYVYARMHGTRVAKNLIIDVLDFTGLGSYHDDERLKDLFKWSTTFAVTPFGGYTKFGDSGHMNNRIQKTSNLYYTNQYGEEAAGLAYWHIGGSHPPSFSASNLFNFILQSTTRPSPIMPKSMLKEQSGAALWDRTDSKEALQGVLYCLKRDDPSINNFGHTLADVNSFDITGYGQHLIMNSGVRYTTPDGSSGNYPGYTPDGGRWHVSKLHNTVLIGNQTSHNQRDGNGLIDGIIGENIEFGTTEAGPAINNGTHKRNLHFVHPISGKSHGYFIVHDEVEPNNSNDDVFINFQMNATFGTTTTITTNQEYNASINGARVNNAIDNPEKVTIFFSSDPEVNIVQSYKGGFDFDSSVHTNGAFESDNVKAKYLASSSDGFVRATTLIFPEDDTHAKPLITKIYNNNYDGVTLTHQNDFVDYYIGASPSSENSYGGTQFKASTTFYRKEGASISMYSSTNGTKFINSGYGGFISDDPISIVMEDLSGLVNLDSATNVTFLKKYLTQVKIDGNTVNPILNRADAVKVNIPQGRHTIELITQAESASFVTPIIQELNNDEITFTINVDYTTTAIGQQVMIDFKSPDNANLLRKTITPALPETQNNIPFTFNIPSEMSPLELGTYRLDLFVRSTNIYGNPVFRNGEASPLEIIDHTLSNTEFEYELSSIKLYPIPAKNILKLSSEKANGLSFEIFTVLGQLKQSGIYNHALDVSNLPTGMYFLKVENSIFKFLKE